MAFDWKSKKLERSHYQPDIGNRFIEANFNAIDCCENTGRAVKNIRRLFLDVIKSEFRGQCELLRG